MFAWLIGSGSTPPLLLDLRSSKTYIIITVSSAIFTDIFVYGIVVPVLPFALASRAHIDPKDIQTWISVFLAVYGAALLVSAPFMGWIADRMTSRRWPLIFGLFALGGATAILCVASSIAVFAIGRVLQGISAAVVWVVGLALLVDTVGTEEIGQAMGYVGLSMSLGILLAPLLGGIVFAASGYYSVFAMAFGLMILDIFLRLTMIEKKVAARWLPSVADAVQTDSPKQGTDLPDAEMNDIELQRPRAPGTGSKLPEIAETSRAPPLQRSASAATTANFEDAADVISPEIAETGTARSLCQSISHSNPAAEEALPPNTPAFFKRVAAHLPPVVFLCGSRRILSAIWACVVEATLLTAFDSILPLYVRDTFHWNSTGAGLIFLPIVIGNIAGPVIGKLSDKHGPRWYATAGFVITCPLMILLRLVTHDTIGQKVLLCALLALIGFALTLVFTPIMAEISYAVDDKAKRRPPGYFGRNGAYAQAYSLFNIAWAAGTMIGPLLAGMLNQSQGWGTATLVLGCLSLVTAVPTAIWTGGSMRKMRKTRREEQQQQQGQQSGQAEGIIAHDISEDNGEPQREQKMHTS